MPEAVAVPCDAWVATATEAAAPPVMFSAIGLPVLLAATLAETALATGACTAITSVYAAVPVTP